MDLGRTRVSAHSSPSGTDIQRDTLFFGYFSTWAGRGLFLEDLFVREAFRSRGIGKALLAAVARIAVEEHCYGIHWEVLDWNEKAIEFYRALGGDVSRSVEAGASHRRSSSATGGEGMVSNRGKEQCGIARRAMGRVICVLRKGRDASQEDSGVCRDAGAERENSRAAENAAGIEIGRMAIIKIIGAGLAGSEAAWQCARRGLDVELFEMRPVCSTPAHQTADFAELVCSNSLKSDSENTAPWLLKEEMRRAGSLLLEIARECAVPAGHALAVDRVTFAARVTEAISREPRITVRREEVTAVDESERRHHHRYWAADLGGAGFRNWAAE